MSTERVWVGKTERGWGVELRVEYAEGDLVEPMNFDSEERTPPVARGIALSIGGGLVFESPMIGRRRGETAQLAAVLVAGYGLTEQINA